MLDWIKFVLNSHPKMKFLVLSLSEIMFSLFRIGAMLTYLISYFASIAFICRHPIYMFIIIQ